MAHPGDDDSGVVRFPPSAPTSPDGGGPPQTLAMWSDAPRSRAPRARQPSPWDQQPSSLPPTLVLTQNPLAPPYGGSVADALRRRPRWALWISLAVAGLVVAGAAALPFLPTVPSFLRPVRDMIAGLTGLGNGGPEEAEEAAGNGAVAAHGPSIVPLPATGQPAPAADATGRPADVRPGRRGAAYAAAHDPAQPAAPLPRQRGWARRRGGLPPMAVPPAGVAPAGRVAAPIDPFDDSHGAARPVQAQREEPPAAPAPVAAAPPPAAPVERAPAPPAAEAAGPKPARMVEPNAAPKPAPTPGSLDDLMATAVQNPPPKKGKSELDRKLAGIDENRDQKDEGSRARGEAPAVHQLTRAEIQAAMKAVQPKVVDCGRQFQSKGSADLKVTVGDDGGVTAVSVGGVFAGTDTAACLERAVKTAAFPPSSGLRFDYPLVLR